jgi:DNA-binding MarR family transcriptional regulator
MKPEETVCFNIKTAWHAIHRMCNGIAASYGSNKSVRFVLLNIDLEHGASFTQSTSPISFESRSIMRVLKNLEEEGFVPRFPDFVDKRLVNIFLTELRNENRETTKQALIKFNDRVRTTILTKQLGVFSTLFNALTLPLLTKIQYNRYEPINP